MKKFFFSMMMILCLTTICWAQWSTDPSVNNSFNPGVTNSSYEVRVATDGTTGNSFIQWFLLEGGMCPYLQMVDVYGVPQWNEGGILVSNHSTNSALYGVELEVSSDGCAVLCISDDRDGMQMKPVVYKINAAGEFLWGPDGITLDNVAAYNTDLAVCNDGSVWAYWEDGSDCHMRHISADGTTLGPIITTSASTGQVGCGQIIADGTDVILAYFVQISGTFMWPNREMYACKYSPDGNAAWDNPTLLMAETSMNFARKIQFEADGLGGGYALCYAPIGQLHQTLLFHVTTTGTATTPTSGIFVSSNGMVNNYNCRMTTNLNTHDAIISFICANGNETMGQIRVQTIDIEGNKLWGEEGIALMEMQTTEIFETSLTSIPSGETIVHFEENNIIYAIRIDALGNTIWNDRAIVSNSPGTKSMTNKTSIFHYGQMILGWVENGIAKAQNLKLDGTIGPITPAVCESPKNLIGTVDYDNEVAIVTWDDVEDAVSYNVFFNGTDVTNFVAAMINENSLTIPFAMLEMMPADEYCITLQTVCNNGVSEMSDQVCITIEEQPEPCEAPTVEGEESEYNGQIAVYLSWNTIEGATGYNIYYGTALLGTTPETDVYITGLEAGQTYCFNITALCASGESNPSNEACVTMSTEPEPCNPPTNLTATANETTINLAWTAPEGATQFKVFRNSVEIATVTTTTYTDSNLTPGNYCYTVKTVCVNELSEPSNQACATIEEPPAGCVAPRLLGEAVIYNDAPAVYLWWEAVEGAVGYNIYHSGALLGSTTQIAINITGAQEGETYCFTVTSLCGSDESDHSNEVCVTIPGNQQVCETPTDLVANAEENHVLLSWSAVEDAIAYRVYANGTEIAIAPENNYTHANIESGTYCYTVRSYCSYGESDLSEEVCIEFINAIDEQDGAFSIFPNPANAQIFVRGENIKRISVYNIIGQMIDSLNVTDSETVINANHYEEGMYLIRITTTDGNVISKRVIIAR